MKQKSEKKEKPKNSEEKKIETKSDIMKKHNTILNTKPQNPDKFPKNLNQFRHIMDDINCCRADIEFMLELRRPKKWLSKDKNQTIGKPQFYQEDINKYKRDTQENQKKENYFKQIQEHFAKFFSNRAKYEINNLTYRYEIGLRTEPNKISKSVGKQDDDKKVAIKNANPWNSTTIPKERSLLDKLLPPVLHPSKIFSLNLIIKSADQ